MGGLLNSTIETRQNGDNDATEGDDVVNPWEVKAESIAGVDYEKLIGKRESMHRLLLTVQDGQTCLFQAGTTQTTNDIKVNF